MTKPKTPTKSPAKTASRTATKAAAKPRAKAAPSTLAGPAAALLEAHVAYTVEHLCGPGLQPLIEGLLDQVLSGAGHIRLEEAVTRDMIKATARTWAMDLDLQGGIPELVGETARALYALPIHEKTRLSDLVPDARFRDILDHILALKSVRKRLAEEIISSPLYESFASDLLYNGIRDYLNNNPLAGKIPGASSAFKLGKALVGRAAAASGLDASVEDSLKRYIGRSIGAVSEKSIQPLVDGAHDAALRDVALDSWLRIRGTALSDLRAEVSALDVEELFVTLYEWWKELRQTDFIGAMIDGGVDAVFDKYGDASLQDLLDDLGISRERMLTEALRFGPHTLGAIHDKGLLEPLVRAALLPFYASGRVEQALGL